jgi:NADPH:quinone reductase-like Zn-dependent oxidoreductase
VNSGFPTDGLRNLFLMLWTSRIEDKKVLLQLPPRQPKQHVRFLKELVQAGRYRSVIDRSYPMEQVADGAGYIETEQKPGNVVLTVSRAQRIN